MHSRIKVRLNYEIMNDLEAILVVQFSYFALLRYLDAKTVGQGQVFLL